MPGMRTTISLDDDVAALVRRRMRERGLGFKETVNEALRLSLSSRAESVCTPTFDLGEPSVPLEKALRLAAELEDEETLRKLALRK